MLEIFEHRQFHIINLDDFSLKVVLILQQDCNWEQLFGCREFVIVNNANEWNVNVKVCTESVTFAILIAIVLLLPLAFFIKSLLTWFSSVCRRTLKCSTIAKEKSYIDNSLKNWNPKVIGPRPASKVTDQDVQNKHHIMRLADSQGKDGMLGHAGGVPRCWSGLRLSHSAGAKATDAGTVAEVQGKADSIEKVLEGVSQSNFSQPRLFIEYIFQEHAAHPKACCGFRRLLNAEACNLFTLFLFAGGLLLSLIMFNLAIIYTAILYEQRGCESIASCAAFTFVRLIDFILVHEGRWLLIAAITYTLYLATQVMGAGHACVRYTLLHENGNIEQRIADLRAVRDKDAVNLVQMYESPGDYFFGFPKGDRMLGGVFSRSFCTIRIDRDKKGRGLNPHKIWAMHYYFKSLSSAHAGNQSGSGALGYDFFGILTTFAYFWFPNVRVNRRDNCAQYISEGLFLAGVLSRPQLFPKAVWVDMFEHFVLGRQACAHVTYYKQITQEINPRAKLLMHSIVTPIQLFKNYYYRKLEPFADIVVEVDQNSEGKLVASARPALKTKRPNAITQFYLRRWHQYVIHTLCISWLLFGWPSRDQAALSQVGGLGARALTVLTALFANSVLY